MHGAGRYDLKSKSWLIEQITLQLMSKHVIYLLNAFALIVHWQGLHCNNAQLLKVGYFFLWKSAFLIAVLK